MFTEWASRTSRMFGETLRRLGGWQSSERRLSGALVCDLSAE